MWSNSVDSDLVILKYINQKKIKGGCQSGRKVVTHDSKSDLPLYTYYEYHVILLNIVCTYLFFLG